MNTLDMCGILSQSDVVKQFHQLYYGVSNQTWMDTKWKGVKLAKCPLDLWQYQEIIVETQPDIIIETGTWWGGSALFLRDMLNLIGKKNAKVITIDSNPMCRINDFSISQIIGDSVSFPTIDLVKNHIGGVDKIMVILDSDHSKKHVLKELDTYAKYVSEGCYLIVEDTNVNGYPVAIEHGNGPWEALEEWLPTHSEFECDKYRERFMMTFNPNGYYKRVKKLVKGGGGE